MIIYGFNPVLEALRADSARVRYVAVGRDGGGKAQRVAGEARRLGIPVRQIEGAQLDRLAGGRVHNGVVAEISDASYAAFEDLISDDTRFVLILDGIQDPQNLGAILRVADGLGIDFVVIPEHQSAGLTSGAVKASAGAAQWVPVVQATNLSRVLEQLKEKGFWVYGATMEGDPITEVDLEGKVAIVMGNEEKGIRKNVLAHCDRAISIPMRGRVGSLNVATATAVIAWEVGRQNR